jgi:hypothetical protein
MNCDSTRCWNGLIILSCMVWMTFIPLIWIILQ